MLRYASQSHAEKTPLASDDNVSRTRYSFWLSIFVRGILLTTLQSSDASKSTWRSRQNIPDVSKTHVTTYVCSKTAHVYIKGEVSISAGSL